MNHDSVSIVVINAKGLRYLKSALSSIVEKTRYRNYELIVLDCATREFHQWIEQFKLENPQIVIRHAHIDNDIGASDEHNRALQLIDRNSKFVIFLDNDVRVVDPEWVDKLVNVLYENQVVAAASPIIVNSNQSDKLQWAGGYLLPNMETYEVNSPVEIPNSDVYETFYFHGAAFIIRRSVLDELRSFGLPMYYNFFFLGHDDIDLSIRLRLRGYKIMVSRETKIYHKVGGTSSRLSSYRIYHWQKNILCILLLNYKDFWTIVKITPLVALMQCLYTLRFRLSVLSVIKAYIWFFKNLKKLLTLKKAVDRYSLYDDEYLMKEMYRVIRRNNIRFLGIKFKVYRHFLRSIVSAFCKNCELG